MHLEIGSEFWEIPISEEIHERFNLNTKWFTSGRAALMNIIEIILSKHKLQQVALPSWCCESMIIPFLKYGLKIIFYPVYFDNQTLIQDLSICQNCDLIFRMAYFGYESKIINNTNNALVVRDVTHSFFSEEFNDADFYFGSLRKWAGFYTGGYAWSNHHQMDNLNDNIDIEYIQLRKSAMRDKKNMILNLREDKSFLNTFHTAENRLDRYSPLFGSYEQDINYASYLDVNFMRKVRYQNATILIGALPDKAIFQLRKEDCPLFVPIRVNRVDRDALRKHLIRNKIYCPIHWTISQYHKVDDKSRVIYEEELSLICDQRYGEADMQRIVKVIEEYYRGASEC